MHVGRRAPLNMAPASSTDLKTMRERECTSMCTQLYASPQLAIAHPTAFKSGSIARIFSYTTSHSSHSNTCERCTAVHLRAHLRCACCVRAVVLPTRSYLRVYMNHLQLINSAPYYCTVLYTVGSLTFSEREHHCHAFSIVGSPRVVQYSTTLVCALHAATESPP